MHPLGQSPAWRNSIVYLLYFNLPAVEHCRKNHTPCRWCHYKLMVTSAISALVAVTQFFFAHLVILLFFCYNDNSSSVMTFWVPTADTADYCLLWTRVFQTLSGLLKSLVLLPTLLLSPNPELQRQQQSNRLTFSP